MYYAVINGVRVTPYFCSPEMVGTFVRMTGLDHRVVRLAREVSK